MQHFCVSGVPEGQLCLQTCPSPPCLTAMTGLVFLFSLQLLMFAQDSGLKGTTISSPDSQMPRNAAQEQGPLVVLTPLLSGSANRDTLFPHQSETSSGEWSQLPHPGTVQSVSEFSRRSRHRLQPCRQEWIIELGFLNVARREGRKIASVHVSCSFLQMPKFNSLKVRGPEKIKPLVSIFLP